MEARWCGAGVGVYFDQPITAAFLNNNQQQNEQQFSYRITGEPSWRCSFTLSRSSYQIQNGQ
jgi:hypothetical protein